MLNVSQAGAKRISMVMHTNIAMAISAIADLQQRTVVTAR